MIRDRANTNYSKTVGEYSMGYKVLASTEQIGDLSQKYSNNHDISPNYPLFIKGKKEIRLLIEGEKNVS